jgi:hypothetical protein
VTAAKVKLNTRNLVWLIAIVVVAAVVWVAVGWAAGLIAGAVVLAASEIIERIRRSRRRAAVGTPKPGR